MPTFSDAAKEWRNLHVKVNCKTGSYNVHRRIVKNHLDPPFGKMKLDEITRPMIEAFIAQKIDEKKAKATIRNYMAALRGILSKAMRDEILNVNRASKMGRFQKETSSKAAAQKIVPLTP
jgi:hypothetical protein